MVSSTAILNTYLMNWNDLRTIHFNWFYTAHASSQMHIYSLSKRTQLAENFALTAKGSRVVAPLSFYLFSERLTTKKGIDHFDWGFVIIIEGRAASALMLKSQRNLTKFSRMLCLRRFRSNIIDSTVHLSIIANKAEILLQNTIQSGERC